MKWQRRARQVDGHHAAMPRRKRRDDRRDHARQRPAPRRVGRRNGNGFAPEQRLGRRCRRRFERRRMDIVPRGGNRGDQALGGLRDRSDGGPGRDRMGAISGRYVQFRCAGAVLGSDYRHDDRNSKVARLAEHPQAEARPVDFGREPIDDGISKSLGSKTAGVRCGERRQ